MPELPEVETVVRTLRPHLTGQTITGVEIYWPRTIATPKPEVFRAQLPGRQIAGVQRRGKFVIIGLEQGDLLVHLRMTGQLLIAAAGAPALKHLRVAIELDGRQLLFNDTRKFGRMYLVPDAAQWLAGLGPEPLGDELTAEMLQARLCGRRTAIKSLLLDQRVLAGVGNIYADEVLHAACIAPHRPGHTLSSTEVQALHAALRSVLAQAIENRGTTFSDYRDGKGDPGQHQQALRVYGQAGAPCPRCGCRIERDRLGGRSAYHCPRCQR